ncbi:hypothetical protein FisN_15Lh067 [Fistulifera solaris]|uniref:Sulfotransferase domain-containing protein n=1 Tax=Fistulifera solaris TaxID=1519565 RepID=A0A1Z5KB29_FISSO|nr:hypothetical protein FisN_15Lh067 [Fistulifera solaris]|eukprot:GAX23352.1 hypothetical protein FisN_15Lh067 [Fistulifera solaris]
MNCHSWKSSYTTTVLLVGSCCLGVLAVAAQQQQQSRSNSKLAGAFEFVLDFVRRKHSSHIDDDSATNGMQVLGAGFARSGTKSTEEALKILGHKVYDTRSMLEHSEHIPRWLRAAEDYKQHHNLTELESLLKDIEAEGYTATLDFPVNLFALPLAELRPNAKVLFTIRDNEEKWFESWSDITHLMGHLICRPWKWLIGNFDFPEQLLTILEDFPRTHSHYPEHIYRPLPWFEILHHPAIVDDPGQKERWIALHRDFQKRCQETLPPDRLLLFNVKQGWAPLLQFLGVDNAELRQHDFPNVNDRSSLQTVRWVMDVVAAGLPVWIALQSYLAYRIARCGVAMITSAATGFEKTKRA